MTRSALSSLAILVLVLILSAAGITVVRAESVTWPSPAQPKIHYTFSGRGAWVNAGFLANITYQARMVDADTGVVLTSGASVPMGDSVRFETVPQVSTDISWSGTGGRYDTPYGEWIVDAGNPNPRSICDLQHFYYRHDDDGMYGRMSIAPPTRTVGTNSSTAFTCADPAANGSVTCTAVRPGTLNANVDFAATYGRMYLAANEWRGTHPGTCDYSQGAGLALVEATGEPYMLDVPEQSVPFTVRAVAAPGLPPTTPVISVLSSGAPTGMGSGVTQCVTGYPFALSLVSTDPDNDGIRYYVDWNGDGLVDQIVPPTGFVSSGTSVALSRTFSLAGTNTVRVLANDDVGLPSSWATFAFNCAEATVESTGEEGAGTGSGSGSSSSSVTTSNLNLRAIPRIVRVGESTRLHWSAGDVTWCEVTGTNGDGGTGWETVVSPLGGKLSGAINEQTTYTLSCITSSDTVITDTATVDIIPLWTER